MKNIPPIFDAQAQSEISSAIAIVKANGYQHSADLLHKMLEEHSAMSARLAVLYEAIGVTQDGVIVFEAEKLFCPKCARQLMDHGNVCYCQACLDKELDRLEFYPEECFADQDAAREYIKQQNNPAPLDGEHLVQDVEPDR